MTLSQQAAIAIGVVGCVVAVAAVGGWVLGIPFRKKKARRTIIDPKVSVPLQIINREFISPDTMRLKLALNSPEDVLGLPVGNHVFFFARINGSMVIRPYTPISLDDQKGYVDFVIKVDPNGKMTQYLSKITIPHHIDVRGPHGRLIYNGKGVFQINNFNGPPVKHTATKVNMICGGSGITPMYQMISHILSDKEDNTKLSLLYANNTEKDILLRDELDQFTSRYSNYFRVWYTVGEAQAGWAYSSGYVTENMISEHLYPPGKDTLVLLCGPLPMLEMACYPHLRALNYPRSRVFTF